MQHPKRIVLGVLFLWRWRLVCGHCLPHKLTVPGIFPTRSEPSLRSCTASTRLAWHAALRAIRAHDRHDHYRRGSDMKPLEEQHTPRKEDPKRKPKPTIRAARWPMTETASPGRIYRFNPITHGVSRYRPAEWNHTSFQPSSILCFCPR